MVAWDLSGERSRKVAVAPAVSRCREDKDGHYGTSWCTESMCVGHPGWARRADPLLVDTPRATLAMSPD